MHLDLALYGKNDVWGEINPDGSPWGLSANVSNSEAKFLSVLRLDMGYSGVSPSPIETVRARRSSGCIDESQAR